MPHDASLTIGRLEVELICEGYAPLALAEELPDREVDWAGEVARFPWAFHDDGAWAWHVHAFVLHTSSGVVLVDTGVGAFGPWEPWAVRAGPDAWAGLDRAAVRDVVLTHLHADHAGGSVLDGAAAFPNARYHVHPADWQHFQEHPAVRARDGARYDARAALSALADRVSMRPLDHDLAGGVTLVHTPGHTPGHRSVLVRDGSEVLLLTGDLLHAPIQIAHPDWLSGHDVDPMLGAASRRRLVFRAADEGWRVGVSHFARPFGLVEGGLWRPV